MRIDMRVIGGSTSLAGAPRGQEALTKLITAIGPDAGEPRPLFFDFVGIEVATASYLRESVLACRDFVRQQRPSYYPVIANANDDVKDELLVLMKARREVVMTCTLGGENKVSDVALLGDLEPAQKTTFELVNEHGETDASALMEKYGEREKTTRTTAWNNRLAALSALGLVVEESRGRAKRYRPLFGFQGA
jgi:hypothetical protein